MSMTTPRVTVPVEPTNEMIRSSLAVEFPATYRDHLRHPDDGPKSSELTEQRIARERKRWTAMLSAAPAPEGGAVKAAFDRIHRLAVEFNPDIQDIDDTLSEINQIALTALATREEAPAGAGDREAVARIIDPAAFAEFDSGAYPSDHELSLEEEEALRKADRILALRAQPQAREEAQPVGWRSIDSAPKDGTVIDVWRAEGGKDTVHWGKPHHDCGEAGGYCDSDWHSIRAPGWVCNTFDEFLGRNHNPFTHWKPLDEGPDAAPSPAYTHPAPDALRVAVEALKPFARAAEKLDGLWSEDDWRWNDSVRSGVTVRDIRHARHALAALQAEQKGGA